MWREIEGYSKYKVNRDGEVWKFKNGKKYKQMSLIREKHCKRNEYAFVYKLTDDFGVRKKLNASRLVATAFLGKPVGDVVAFHKNKIFSDVSVHNLIWLPRSKAQKISSSLNSHKVVKIDQEGNDVEYYKSCKEAGIKNYLSPNCIREHCKGKRYDGKLFKGGLLCIDGYYYAYDDDTEESRNRVYAEIERKKVTQ